MSPLSFLITTYDIGDIKAMNESIVSQTKSNSKNENLCTIISEEDGQVYQGTIEEIFNSPPSFFGSEDIQHIRYHLISMTISGEGMEVSLGKHKFRVFYKIIKDSIDSAHPDDKQDVINIFQKKLFGQSVDENKQDAVPTLDPDREKYIYAILTNDMRFVKVGSSGHDPSKGRLPSLQIANPEPLVLHSYIRADKSVERLLHKKFAEYRKSGEWFDAAILPELILAFEELAIQQLS